MTMKLVNRDREGVGCIALPWDLLGGSRLNVDVCFWSSTSFVVRKECLMVSASFSTNFTFSHLRYGVRFSCF